ncbi:hypothetical protein CEXT_648671 [Caerostris extrusa]|uniref:Secreted protein n=1 Tax=Caerostris extrusa TaxID=172846 RepID=A0AAV4M862_CAEEX|nr:hypothetical protein CEXT_648671 [Caerostris extrusa]
MIFWIVVLPVNRLQRIFGYKAALTQQSFEATIICERIERNCPISCQIVVVMPLCCIPVISVAGHLCHFRRPSWSSSSWKLDFNF